MAVKTSLGELFKAAWYAVFAFVLPRKLWIRLIRRRFRELDQALKDDVTDSFLELLLGGMRVALVCFPGYARNLSGWHGTLVFRTTNGRVAASAMFKDGRMTVIEDEVADYQAMIVFKDGAALRAFLLSKDQDIFNSLLANDVSVRGNLNYVYKFGFLSKDLLFRLRLVF